MNIPARPGLGSLGPFFHAGVAESDPDVNAAMNRELHRQREEIELIASENIVSKA
ncbi:MAG: serine hydroxymethyltransferase, partial [Mesorhizobium sp.]